MNIYKFLSGLLKGRFILTLLIVAFGSGSLYAQHLFSVDYGDLSQDKASLIRTELARVTVLQATALQAGIYFYTLICDGKPVDTKQMIFNEIKFGRIEL